LAHKLVRLLTMCPGATIFGRHQGAKVAGALEPRHGRERYGHLPELWKDLWKSTFKGYVGETFTERNVVVEAELIEINAIVEGHENNFYFLFWSVTIE